MMDIVPSINCPDERCAEEKLAVLKTFLPAGELVHVDVTDGVFTPHKTWSDPRGWTALKSPFALEVHLMVEFPLEHAEDWLAAGARRLVIHAEAIEGNVLHGLSQLADRYRADLMLTSRPETTVEELEPFLKKFTQFQVLSVVPGAAGQEFLAIALEKIRFLREDSPDATIEVDGGINLETAKLVKSAGADTIVSANYLFESTDPKGAYEALQKI